MKKTEISLTEVFRIIKRRKNILFISVLLSIVAALLYNTFKKPVYATSVLLKKENVVDNNNNRDEVKNILLAQSQDALETEMELVKTRKVLNSVIDKLSLNVYISKIVFPDGSSQTLNESLLDYQNNYRLKYDHNLYPKINAFNIGIKTKDAKFVAKNNLKNSFSIIESKNNSSQNNNHKYSELDQSEWNVDIEWPNTESKSEIIFNTIDYNKVITSLDKSIGVFKRIKTNIFEISVESQSTYAAKEIANTIANEFREKRLLLQKDNIHTSFKFIDNQLKKI